MRTRILPFFLALVLCSDISRAEEIVHIATDEWPPYQSQHLQNYGVISELISEAFQQEGIKVQWHWLPWSRALVETKLGKWDGVSLSLKNKEREKDFFFPSPIFIEQRYFFHRKDSTFDWNTLSDLKQFKIVAIIGYNYGKLFEDAEKMKVINVVRVPTIDQALGMIARGRADIFPELKLTGYFEIRRKLSKDDAQQLTHHPKNFDSTAYYLIFPKIKPNSKPLMEQFESGFSALKKSGKIDQYRAEHTTPSQ